MCVGENKLMSLKSVEPQSLFEEWCTIMVGLPAVADFQHRMLVNSKREI